MNKTLNECEQAYLGGGCFWGVEYYMRKLHGIIDVKVGYMGGLSDCPTYEQVCADNGYVEVVEVCFDKRVVSYEEIVKRFMEIHDPTQLNRQGPDVGMQYRSVIFYLNDQQRAIAEAVIKTLKLGGYEVVTALEPASHFWMGEEYHQDYYRRKGKEPYCHGYVKRF